MSDVIEIPKFHIPKSKELGDFQTPYTLTKSICCLVDKEKFTPTLLLEPSCGKGNFIISALETFPSIKTVIAIELQEHYKEEFFSQLMESKIDLNTKKVIFITKSFFEINFKDIFETNGISIKQESVLILGNPPWVTNSYLGTVNVSNLPKKSNFKIKLKGLDALTGKSNFDIAETFILRLLDQFYTTNFYLLQICKTSTAQNILRNYKLYIDRFSISSYIINAKKEFDISASANVLHFRNSCDASHEPKCSVYSLNEPNNLLYSFGYSNGKFVSNIVNYSSLSVLEGQFCYQWRQGLKHDASSILVLEKLADGIYKNKLKERILLENEFIYPLVKSSDIKHPVLQKTKYFVLVTQTKFGKNGEVDFGPFPKTLNYLESKIEYFSKRKSKIYQNQSKYAIFGIGDYSFKKFKIVISGFYKKLQFSLLLSCNDKPIMVDDTCYTISFDSLVEAVFIWIILASSKVEKFIKSITFIDNKRPYKKEVLQRLDVHHLLKILSDNEFEKYFKELEKYELPITFQEVLAFKKNFMHQNSN